MRKRCRPDGRGTVRICLRRPSHQEGCHAPAEGAKSLLKRHDVVDSVRRRRAPVSVRRAHWFVVAGTRNPFPHPNVVPLRVKPAVPRLPPVEQHHLRLGVGRAVEHAWTGLVSVAPLKCPSARRPHLTPLEVLRSESARSQTLQGAPLAHTASAESCTRSSRPRHLLSSTYTR